MRLLAYMLTLLMLICTPAQVVYARPTDTPAPYERQACVPLDDIALPAAGSPFSVEGDIGIAIGDTWYPALRDFSALRMALGEPQEVLLTESLVHPEHFDKEFIYDFGSVHTHPVDGVDIWYELYVTAGELVTARGIGVGSTAADMLAAYGDEYFIRGDGTYVYSLAGSEPEYATPMVTICADECGVLSFGVFYPVFDERHAEDAPQITPSAGAQDML